MTITVNAVNDPPIAIPDSTTTDEDECVSGNMVNGGLSVGGEADSDPEGDAITVDATPLSNPTNGQVTINSADQTFTYCPNPDFNGQDSFVYEISDGQGGIASAPVFITVTPVNDPPVAQPDSFATSEDKCFTGMLMDGSLSGGIKDSDPDGDRLTINTNPVTAPSHGTVDITANPQGRFTYCPDANYNGPDSFVYEITDDSGAPATATGEFRLMPVVCLLFRVLRLFVCWNP